MLTPIVEGHTPRICAGMGTERSQAMQFRFPGKPSAVLLTDGAIRSFDLGVVKDGFAEDKIAIGSPRKIVQGVVGILGTEPGQDGLSMIRLAIAVGILEESHVGLFRNIDSSVTELEGKRHVDIVRPDRGLVRLAVAIEILENNDLVVRGLPGVNMRIGG